MGGGTHTASFDGFLRAIALQDGDRVRSRWAQEPGSVGLGAGVQHCWLSLEERHVVRGGLRSGVGGAASCRCRLQRWEEGSCTVLYLVGGNAHIKRHPDTPNM